MDQTKELMRTLLANRMYMHDNVIENARGEMTEKAYAPDDYQKIASTITDSLGAIGELQRIWEVLFDEVPTMHEVHMYRTQEG